jgi:hypothetical protein
MLEHCRIEFESRVIDKLSDLFAGENLFLSLSVSFDETRVFFFVNVGKRSSEELRFFDCRAEFPPTLFNSLDCHDPDLAQFLGLCGGVSAGRWSQMKVRDFEGRAEDSSSIILFAYAPVEVGEGIFFTVDFESSLMMSALELIETFLTCRLSRTRNEQLTIQASYVFV